MLSSRQFIRTDTFSFTCVGNPWVAYEWLGECFMAILDRIGGLDTLLLATATILAGLYTWAASRLMRSGLHWLPTLFLTMLTISASANHLHVRPHIATIVFLGLSFACLCDYEAGRIGLSRLCWLIPLFWIWSNMHGGALAGLATMIMALAGWWVFRLMRLSTPIKTLRQAVALFLLIMACGLTAVLNPYGLRLPAVWLEIMRSPVVARLIEEHAPLALGSPDGTAIVTLGLVYVGMLASLRPWRPRVTWLVPLFWLLQTFLRVRHSPLFSITAALAMAEMLPRSRLADFLARPGRDLYRFPPEDAVGERALDPRPALFPLSIVLLAVILQASGVRAPLVGRGWARLDPTYWPVELLPALRDVEGSHPEGARIFNDFLYGGFLIYYTPGLKVFIDDRCELYGDDRLLRFWEATRIDPARIDDWARSCEIQYALVATGSQCDRFLARSAHWRTVVRSRTAGLYERIPSRTDGRTTSRNSVGPISGERYSRSPLRRNVCHVISEGSPDSTIRGRGGSQPSEPDITVA
jgi:hypothetical protein